MTELGLPPATTHIRGGETEGRRRLVQWLSDEERVAKFSKPKTAPTSLEPSTSLMSPYLKFGCVSVRELYWRAKDITTAWLPAQEVTRGPENMVGQVSYEALHALSNAVRLTLSSLSSGTCTTLQVSFATMLH